MHRCEELLMIIEMLKLSSRPYNALKNAGIKTVEELLVLDRYDIMDIKALGPKGRREIKERLEWFGLDCEEFE